jgi:hypothetical protein
MHTRSMRPSASAAYNQRFRWMLDHGPAVPVLARFRTMSPAARSVLEFLGAHVADNDIRDLRNGSGFMAMLDKDDARACPAAENPYVPEMWAFVRWHGPKPPAVAAGIVNRALARNILVTTSMGLGCVHGCPR